MHYKLHKNWKNIVLLPYFFRLAVEWWWGSWKNRGWYLSTWEMNTFGVEFAFKLRLKCFPLLPCTVTTERHSKRETDKGIRKLHCLASTLRIYLFSILYRLIWHDASLSKKKSISTWLVATHTLYNKSPISLNEHPANRITRQFNNK